MIMTSKHDHDLNTPCQVLDILLVENNPALLRTTSPNIREGNPSPDGSPAVQPITGDGIGRVASGVSVASVSSISSVSSIAVDTEDVLERTTSAEDGLRTLRGLVEEVSRGLNGMGERYPILWLHILALLRGSLSSTSI